MSIAFLLGIGLADLAQWPLLLWLGLCLAAGIFWLLLRRREATASRVLLPLALAVLVAGAARFQLTQLPPTSGDLDYYTNQRLALVGKIAEPPVRHDSYTEVRLRAQYLVSDMGEQSPVQGLVLLRLPLDADWHYGDRLRLEGRLEAPPSGRDFSYADYLARFGIQSIMAFPDVRFVGTGAANPVLKALYAFRSSGLTAVYRLYPDPEASLLAGILLGDESGLSADLKEIYNATGLRHIIAISGFNITIVAGLLLAAFSRWLGARRGAWLAAGGIALYTILVGADAPVLRAAIMGGLALLARQTGRSQLGFNTLAFTAAVMALINLLLLWDVGFQLSFAATLGILLYTQPMTDWFHRWLETRFKPDWVERLTNTMSELVFITLAAQLTTLPMLLYHFQRISPLSLPANLLVLPVQPALMVLGGLSVILGMAWFPMGQLLALFAWPLAAWSNRIAELFASLPGVSYSTAPLGLAGLALIYLALFSFTLGWSWLRPRLPRPRPALLAAALAAAAIWLWSQALSAPDGGLRLTLLDVEGGEALLLQTPEGRSLLINGGASAVDLATELGRSLPPGRRQLDWLLVAGVRQEQLAGLVNSLERLAPLGVA